MLAGQIGGQLIDDLLSVVSTVLSALFVLDDAATNFPVGCRQNTVDPACHGAACGIQQFRNAR